MATPPYSGVSTVEPSAAIPDVTNHTQASGQEFGAGVGAAQSQAAEKEGNALEKVGITFNQVAADDASNQFQSAADKLLHGDPDKKNSDGSPDLGFIGLKGADALKAFPTYAKQLEDLRKKTRGGLLDTQQISEFDNYSRRYNAVITSQMSGHADTQSLAYAADTSTATMKLQADKITRVSSTVQDPALEEEQFKHHEQDLIDATVKTAQAKSGKLLQPGDPLYDEAVSTGKQIAMKSRVEAISVKDPIRALDLVEQNKDSLGPLYEPLSQQFRARVDTEKGNAVGDAAIASSGATIKGPGGRVSPSTVHKAIVGQESGGQQFDSKGNVLTSVDGAQGAGQMLPATFQKYALPGEVITNREDNLAASRRAIDDYYKKYNGDAARVAVAYFSGEGNVAPPGSPTPWITDAKDGNGKSVSGYVGDIQGRLGVSPPADKDATPASGGTTAAVQNFAQMEANATSKILQMHLPAAQEAHALQRVRTTFQSARVADEQTKAASKARNDEAADNWVKVLHAPIAPGRDVVHEIMSDPNLTWETRRALGDAAEKHAGNDAQQATADYGPGFWDAYKSVNLPNGDPNRISDPTTLLNRAGPKGDLTLAGVEKLMKTMKENTTTVDSSSINTTKTGLMKYAEGLLSYDNETQAFGGSPLKDPKGRQAFNAEFIPRFESAYAQWIKDGKDPYQFLTRENVQKMAYGIRSPNQVAVDKLIATGGTGQPEAPNAPIPPPPEGVKKAGWDSLMQTPPLLKNSGERMSHAQWSTVLQQLRENDTPQMREAFDKWGASAGFKAGEVLDRMSGKSPAVPAGPAPTAAQTGVMPPATLPAPAPEAAPAAAPKGEAPEHKAVREARKSAIDEGLLAISEGRKPADIPVEAAPAPGITPEQAAARQAAGQSRINQITAGPKQNEAVRDEIHRRAVSASAKREQEQLQAQLDQLDTKEKGDLNSTQKDILGRQRAWLKEQLDASKKRGGP